MAKRQLGLAEAFRNVPGASTRMLSPPAPPPAKRPRKGSSSSSGRPIDAAIAPGGGSTASLSTAAAPAGTPASGRDGVKPEKTTPKSSSPSTVCFSPSAFRSTLSTSGPAPSEADLLALECSTLDPSWLQHLQHELRKPYFLDLKRFLWSEGLQGTQDREKGKLKVFPPAHDVYAWSRYTPLQSVKVVILGQDPYHDDGQAHGLCFSVRPGVRIPPSLRNIYKEIKDEYPAFEVPKHGNLITLARSGVLLLNTSLTVSPHKAGSHSNKGWETFTEKVVDLVDQHGGQRKGVVVLAWGAWAAKRVAKMDKKKHLILTSAHPSPLSAHRGFFGNGHFKKANDWLAKRHGDDAQIDWTRLEPEEEEAGLDKI